MTTLREEQSRKPAVTPLHRYNGLSIRAGGLSGGDGVTARNVSSRVDREPRLRVVLGPPGCGKTTRLLELLHDEVRGGVPPARVGFVTFTRAARQQVQDQVVERLGLSLTDLPWLRTLHSAAFRLLELRKDQVLADERWGEFAKRHGYRLSDVPGASDVEDAPSELPWRTPDDAVRAVYSWGRSRCLGADQTLARCRPGRAVSASALRLFWKRLDAFKAEHEVFDFPDLLDAVLDRGLRPDIDVLFIDEAQDLSPQQVAVVESWFPRCARVHVAGDEDQAVYVFQGADPGWLLDLANRGELERLHQSRRVPAAVHAMATRIIGQNKARLPKDYLPRPAIGSVRFLDERAALAAIDGERSTFVLARNRLYLGRWARELMARGVPFLVEGRGGVSPLSEGRSRTAVELVLRLGQGVADHERVTAAELDALLALVSGASGLVPRGAKTRAREARRARSIFTGAELRAELGLTALLDALTGGSGLGLLSGLRAKDRRYFEALIARHGALPKPRVTLTSMHGAKGREAELVVVLPDLARSTARELLGGAAGREAENRVFYVAVTRAIEDLIVVAPRGRRHYAFPSFHFEEGRL